MKTIKTDQTYYSNGKLLITGEYLVIDGALAFALPLRFGQSLKVGESNDLTLEWETYVLGERWFSGKFDRTSLEPLENFNQSISNFLSLILKAARNINPGFLMSDEKLSIITNLNFNIEWGLGSSSSLISNVAYLAGIDPFLLHRMASSGSGYDIACARAKAPLIYRNDPVYPLTEEIDFRPGFLDHIYFIYTGRKQDTQSSVSEYKAKSSKSQSDIATMTELTRELIKAQDLKDFGMIINEHEKLISGIINEAPVQGEYFFDFPGVIKSLGAWGGDFIMAVSDADDSWIRKYFLRKSLNIIFGYRDIVIDKTGSTE